MQGIRANRRVIIESLFIFLLLSLIAIDQITKCHFSHAIKLGEKEPVIDGLFYFAYEINTGASFSFLSEVSWAQTFFKILTSLALVLFIVLYVIAIKNKLRWLKVGLIFIISGTIGNFIDRLAINGVIDFISFTFFPFVFNLADVFLIVGAIMLVIHFLFLDKNAIFKRKDADKEVSKQ